MSYALCITTGGHVSGIYDNLDRAIDQAQAKPFPAVCSIWDLDRGDHCWLGFQLKRCEVEYSRDYISHMFFKKHMKKCPKSQCRTV